MNRRKKIVKGTISYILALFLAVFFALYLNATVGWFILVALILALVLSVFFAFLTTLGVTVECGMDDCMLAKGDTCQMTISVHNKSLFPTTPVEIIMQNGEGVKCEEKSLLVTVLPFETRTLYVNFKAKICGPSTVGIKAVKATDYLGLFALHIRKVCYDKLTAKVAVIPEMGDVSPRDDRILKVVQASCYGEDGDDTVEGGSNLFGGFPGYDHREYVPGDSLKCINWKQSAKRGKLLIRLPDMLASKSVNLVLDSAFFRELADPDTLLQSSLYSKTDKEDIRAKLAEDAVETALGIMKTLVLSSYFVTFFVSKEGRFESYAIEDEKDIEMMRLMLAEYSFYPKRDIERFPKEIILDNQSSFIYCTPNDYKDVYSGLKEGVNAGGISVFSILGEAVKFMVEKEAVKKKEKKKKSQTIAEKRGMKSLVFSLIIPYMLALISGVALFAVFGVSPLSVWTLLQAVVVLLVFVLCEYARRHKIIGSLLIGIVIVGALFFFSQVAFSGIEYMQWFMSGADNIENTVSYLMSLVLVFTLLFSMVLFYYTQMYYRTSAILLVSIIPYVVYVKLIREVEIGYVAITVILNVAAFLINTRKQRDKDKRIVAFGQGLLSVCVYALCFILMTFAVPKDDETKYYHFFEEWFLGGNTSVPLPEEFGDKSDYSGNADSFNQLTNRQLYNIYDADMSENLYVKRQVFDYYDFENNRWYDDSRYSAYQESNTLYSSGKQYLSNEKLFACLLRGEELSPGFLEKYGLEDLQDAEYADVVNSAVFSARNFESYYLVTPTRTLTVNTENDDYVDMTSHGVYGNETTPFKRNIYYNVTYISEFDAKTEWIALGGSNMDYETSQKMLEELASIFQSYPEESKVVEAFLWESRFADEYASVCEENTESIPESIRQLAMEITKDCTYEWEKAEALSDYFHRSDFTYDLEYVAPDNSVEYFLFEGKTGTCSDFATAYVLMARAVGLTVRYAEGFVPDREISATYEWQYVVRTKTSHAYPEVYIPNLGFVVYEPTVRGIGEMEMSQNAGVMAYITTLLFRIVRIFAGVALLIGLILIISRIITPALLEKHFFNQISKKEHNQAIKMLYQRTLEKQTASYIKTPFVNTPYEYAKKYETIFGQDISTLTYLVEKAAYANVSLTENERKEALTIYKDVKKTVKEYKRNKKEKRNK